MSAGLACWLRPERRRRSSTALNAEVKQITEQPAYRERMQKIHVEPVSDSPAEFKTLIDSESERLGALIRKIDIKVDQ